MSAFYSGYSSPRSQQLSNIADHIRDQKNSIIDQLASQPTTINHPSSPPIIRPTTDSLSLPPIHKPVKVSQPVVLEATSIPIQPTASRLPQLMLAGMVQLALIGVVVGLAVNGQMTSWHSGLMTLALVLLTESVLLVSKQMQMAGRLIATVCMIVGCVVGEYRSTTHTRMGILTIFVLGIQYLLGYFLTNKSHSVKVGYLTLVLGWATAWLALQLVPSNQWIWFILYSMLILGIFL